MSRIAEIAFEVNDNTENIGARRLHTILEKLLEELSYEAADIGPATIKITPTYVDEKLTGNCKKQRFVTIYSLINHFSLFND